MNARQKVTNSELLRLATYHGNPRPGNARHVTPNNVRRLQEILNMHPGRADGGRRQNIDASHASVRLSSLA
jgi:hypothetical protein